jgi:hypothetical protein
VPYEVYVGEGSEVLVRLIWPYFAFEEAGGDSKLGTWTHVECWRHTVRRLSLEMVTPGVTA